MTCKTYMETGEVPLDCLFKCTRGCVHEPVEPRGTARCNTCGSTDVRWRQQGGRWVLFSLQPGVVHQCSHDDLAGDFEVLT